MSIILNARTYHGSDEWLIFLPEWQAIEWLPTYDLLVPRRDHREELDLQMLPFFRYVSDGDAEELLHLWALPLGVVNP